MSLVSCVWRLVTFYHAELQKKRLGKFCQVQAGATIALKDCLVHVSLAYHKVMFCTLSATQTVLQRGGLWLFTPYLNVRPYTDLDEV